VKQHGEPAWIDLLDEEHRFVEGGKVWKRKDEVKNLEISPNSTELVSVETRPFSAEVFKVGGQG